MSEEWTVVPIPYPTTVNVQITVPEMANGGKPRQTCDHLHRELSTCVNYQKKKGLLLSLPNRGNHNHKLSNMR